MRILALDVGFKRVGVAISSVDRNLVYPLSVISMERFRGAVFFDLLRRSLEKYWGEIDSVIIGDGRDLEGANPAAKIANQVERILKS